MKDKNTNATKATSKATAKTTAKTSAGLSKRKPAASPDGTASVVKALREKLVSDEAIEVLKQQKMLNQEDLTDATTDDLKGLLLLGDVLKVKRAFPSQAKESVPSPRQSGIRNTSTVTKFVLTQEKRTDAHVITELAQALTADLIEEAQQRFGDRKMFVTRADGSLDLDPTLEALQFIALHGPIDRFENSAGTSVKLVNLSDLMNVETDLNPLTLRVLVPGDAMLNELTEAQRLLVAFGVVTGAVKSDENEDLVISQVQSGKGRFAQLKTDFTLAERQKSHQYYQASSRVRRSR